MERQKRVVGCSFSQVSQICTRSVRFHPSIAIWFGCPNNRYDWPRSARYDNGRFYTKLCHFSRSGPESAVAASTVVGRTARRMAELLTNSAIPSEGSMRTSCLALRNGYWANHSGYQQGGGRRKDGYPNRVRRCVAADLPNGAGELSPISWLDPPGDLVRLKFSNI